MIDLTNYICFKVVTPNDIEDEHAQAIREKTRKNKVKVIIQQVMTEVKSKRCDKKKINQFLSYAIEVLESK